MGLAPARQYEFSWRLSRGRWKRSRWVVLSAGSKDLPIEKAILKAAAVLAKVGSQFP